MSIIASFFVLSGILLSLFVYLDTKKNKQSMPVMDIVWPLTMLWASWIGFAAYLSFGREKASMKDIDSMSVKAKDMSTMSKNSMKKNSMDMDSMDTDSMDKSKANMNAMDKSKASKMDMDSMDTGSMDMGAMQINSTAKPRWQGISLSTLHCGAGCTLADIIGESLASVMGLALISGWVLDYALALLIGVYFQYMAIQQMGRMQPQQAIAKALKVDFLSLSAWQVGMYGFMAIYLAFSAGGAGRLSFDFWFAMQIAMLAGFFVAYPMNQWLIHKGIKHAM